MLWHLAASSCLCKHCHSKQQCFCQVPCPNNCGQDVLKDEIHEHKKVCPFEVVQCEYHCGAKLVRCEKDKHLRRCQVEHFQLMCNESMKNIFEEIKRNATKITEVKSTKEECSNKIEIKFDILKQSTTDIEQISINCQEQCEKNKILFSRHSKLLLILLFLLVIITVMTIYWYKCNCRPIIPMLMK